MSLSAIFGCAGTALSADEAAFFKDAQPWGFILFARNLDAPDQIHKLCDDLRQSVGWHAPILIDQEGGRVERMGRPHWHSFPPPLDQATHAHSERLFWLRGRIIAHDLLSCGITVNCAPLLDVATDETHPFLRNRCYGITAEIVTRHGRAMMHGLMDGGVLGVVKHMPGHGRGQADSHLELPRVTASRAELEQDFAPFRALSDQPLGMTGHMVLNALDAARSATQSDTVLSFIRNDIGFDGLLMTDDISMEALSGDVVTRGQAALAAGCDLVLHCNGDLAEMTSLAQALPVLSPAAQVRAARATEIALSPSSIDIEALWAEFDALVTETR